MSFRDRKFNSREIIEKLYTGSYMQGFVKNIAVSSILGAIFVMMSVGGMLSSEMMLQDGSMMPCPFMGTATVCNMSPLEHVAGWQQMFVAALKQFGANTLLLLLALALVFLSVGGLFSPKVFQTRLVYRHRYRQRIFDPLRLAFARGIIHSKAF